MVGRNDPCPCGSGNKYKKCCLAKDREQQPEVSLLPPPRQPETPSQEQTTLVSPRPNVAPPRPETPPPPDPHTEAVNARWDQFKSRDYEDRIAVFLDTVEDEQLMDSDLAYEMLASIRRQSLKRDERERFDSLVQTVRERLPHIFEENAAYFCHWMVKDALHLGQDEAVESWAVTMAELAGDDLDMFYWVIDELAYHGQLSTLVKMSRAAWPKVYDSPKLIAGADSRFADRAVIYEVLEYCSQTETPQADAPQLRERLAWFEGPADFPWMADWLGCLSGRSQRDWTLADFENGGRPGKASKNGPWPIWLLTMEFLGSIFREGDVPVTRGDLARRELMDYVLQRADGSLDPRKSDVWSPSRSRPRRHPKGEHPLCPDGATFDPFLGQQLDLFSTGYYRVAALIELVPAWLRFLESRQLIDADRTTHVLAQLPVIWTPFLKLVDNDPELRPIGPNLRSAWDMPHSP